MTGDPQDARETKILSDILALVLDEQEGVSTAAIANIKHRAHADGVTGGALKQIFVRLRDAHEAPLNSGSDDALHMALTRSRMHNNEMQSQVAYSEHLRRHDLARLTLATRQARLLAAVTGLLAGTGFGFLASSAVGALVR